MFYTLIFLIAALCLYNPLYILVLIAVSSILLIIFRKELLFAVLTGFLIALLLIITEADTVHGPLAKDIGVPFDSELLVIETDYSGKNKVAVCKILNKDNKKVQAYFYGEELPVVNDVVTVKGLTLKSPADSGEKYEYYNRQLKSKGIFYTAFIGEKNYTITAHNQGSFPAKQSRSLNIFLNNKIANTFKNPRTCAFIQGLMLGNKENITEEDYEALQISGCIHIASVSGFHVMLLLSILAVFLKKLPNILRDIIYILFLFLLILVTGCSPSVIRASVMVIIAIVSVYFKRDKDTLNALCLVAIMLIISNRYIIYNASFVLSFTATFGIIMCSGYIKTLLSPLPALIRDPACATISAQIGVFPAMMMYFGTLSTYSIVTNVVISLTVPLLFILAPITMILNITPLKFICDTICNFIYETAYTVAYAPFNTITFDVNIFSLILFTCTSLFICFLFKHLQIRAFQKTLKE